MNAAAASLATQANFQQQLFDKHIDQAGYKISSLFLDFLHK
jgi:hypothetical protein